MCVMLQGPACEKSHFLLFFFLDFSQGELLGGLYFFVFFPLFYVGCQRTILQYSLSLCLRLRLYCLFFFPVVVAVVSTVVLLAMSCLKEQNVIVNPLFFFFFFVLSFSPSFRELLCGSLDCVDDVINCECRSSFTSFLFFFWCVYRRGNFSYAVSLCAPHPPLPLLLFTSSMFFIIIVIIITIIITIIIFDDVIVASLPFFFMCYFLMANLREDCYVEKERRAMRAKQCFRCFGQKALFFFSVFVCLFFFSPLFFSFL